MDVLSHVNLRSTQLVGVRRSPAGVSSLEYPSYICKKLFYSRLLIPYTSHPKDLRLINHGTVKHAAGLAKRQLLAIHRTPPSLHSVYTVFEMSGIRVVVCVVQDEHYKMLSI